MMRSTTNKNGNNTVVTDRQWIRRVKQEEINMIDSFSGPKKETIAVARDAQTKNHFYPQHTRMANTLLPKAAAPSQMGGAAASYQHQEDTKSRASRARDSDGLDSVSQVSVLTPKSRASVAGSRMGDSVSYMSQ